LEVEFNILRLEHLLALYRMSVDELLAIINKDRARLYTANQINSGKVEINCLKRIDKLFRKGLHYYFDSNPPIKSTDASIFFRKSEFGSDLNFEAVRVVNKYEELKISLSGLSKLSEINTERILPLYSVTDNPHCVAKSIRELLYPQKKTSKREFLKLLISNLAEHNILVFEFIETSNKKEKANLDGFYLNPNFIVLKRHQKAFSREIFTLVHELAHYLLDAEEIEKVETSNLANKNLSSIERWCNDFAYYFLVGDYNAIINNFTLVNESNNFYLEKIEEISRNTHLSRIALYTHLLFQNKITTRNYNIIKDYIDEQFRLNQEKDNQQKEQDKINGIKKIVSTSRPINSPLFISTLQAAFYEGLINEYNFCKTLNIKPQQLAYYIQ